MRIGIARAIEYMIVDALLAAEPKMRFARHIRNPKQYVYLTDDLMPRIEASEDPVCVSIIFVLFSFFFELLD